MTYDTVYEKSLTLVIVSISVAVVEAAIIPQPVAVHYRLEPGAESYARVAVLAPRNTERVGGRGQRPRRAIAQNVSVVLPQRHVER